MHGLPLTGLGPFLGIEIICSRLVPDEKTSWQYRFPRSKKRRIRRKWAKDLRNWKTEVKPVMYQMGNRIICSPTAYAQLMGELGKFNSGTGQLTL